MNNSELKDALFSTAAVGLILSTSACVAGAEGGCQAEVGSAATIAGFEARLIKVKP